MNALLAIKRAMAATVNETSLHHYIYLYEHELTCHLFRIILPLPVRRARQPRFGMEVSANRRLLCVWSSVRLVFVYLFAAPSRKQIRCQARCMSFQRRFNQDSACWPLPDAWDLNHHLFWQLAMVSPWDRQWLSKGCKWNLCVNLHIYQQLQYRRMLKSVTINSQTKYLQPTSARKAPKSQKRWTSTSTSSRAGGIYPTGSHHLGPFSTPHYAQTMHYTRSRKKETLQSSEETSSKPTIHFCSESWAVRMCWISGSRASLIWWAS